MSDNCTCPAGQVTHNIVLAGRRTDAAGRVHRLRAFQFDGSECMTCPLRSQCISAKGRKGRWVLIHPQEALLQQARALQQSAAYDEYRGRRVVVEHRLARLVHLGIRQSRYFGRVKTKFQMFLAATVANLTLVAGKLGRSGRADDDFSSCGTHWTEAIPAVLDFLPARFGQLLTPALLAPTSLLKFILPTKAFRPDF